MPEEAVECTRVEQVEAECQEKEASEAQEKEAWERAEHAYAMDSETEFYVVLSQWSETPVVDRPGMSVPVPAAPGNPGLAEGSKVKGKAKAHDLVPVGLCAQCVSTGVECTFELVKANWHTSKMAKHQQIAKQTQHMQRQFNDCLFDLLQETEYWQVAEVGELSDEKTTSEETSDGETDKDAEGEEAPESDLEMKTGSQGWQKGLEVLEEGDGGDVNRSLKYQKGTEVASKAGGSEGWRVAASASQSCGAPASGNLPVP
ncbi:hypothetical protein EDC04DRAFT_2614455 [Pisolithus marmoratus]|nr:hypothetical protein EDC04DRAFT_2614455 [Pisolithus marmoratus]